MLKKGLYEEIINKQLREELKHLDDTYDIEKESIDVEDARKVLSAYISHVTRRALHYVRDQEKDPSDALLAQIKTCNDIIQTLSEKLDEDEFNSLHIEEKGEVLHSVYSKLNTIDKMKNSKPIRPVTPLSQSSLFTGSNFEPNMLSELKKEILSSDRIDFLVSFIKWSGLRVIMEELEKFTQSGGQLRVITTSYMEATDYKAIMELSQLKNTDIKISYDVERTRLHAKAYLFKRDTGFSTAYIGSSNLSNPALTSGLEWNMKVTEKDSFDIIKKFEATFESYWNDSEFKTFQADQEQDHERLKRALKKKGVHEADFSFSFHIEPYHYQQEMLEKLQVEREVFGRNKNLLVAATGVGKTVVSAFDYRRFRKKNGQQARLLFVAHREEILKQSRDTFRAILNDYNFGDLLVGGHVPERLDHLFVSVQSLNSTNLYENTETTYYDYIIVDEFHHAAAKSYQKLLEYYNPKVLLGLTATPERRDGGDIFSYFDHVVASEMRLPEAINKKLLSPFQYFCVTDTEDLSKLKWRHKGYDINELEHVYTDNKVRSNQIVKSLYKYVTDVDEVKGLGFCVSIKHAEYMAHFFNQKGIRAVYLHGGSDKETRLSAKQRLINGDIKLIFVVDLYNEGVDIPEVNTVLFLRPTESLTVFLQQLGRGLRLAEGKECLTVLDFVGRAHQNYNFEEKFRALIGKTKHSVRHYVEQGFFNVPKGSFIQLEKQAKENILSNIKTSMNTRSGLVKKLKYFKEDTGLDVTLENVLEHYRMSLYDFYGKNGDRSFVRLGVEAGIFEEFIHPDEKKITKRLPHLLHLNSRKLLSFLLNYIQHGAMHTKEETQMLAMFYYSFYKDVPYKEGFTSIEEGVKHVLRSQQMTYEIKSILSYNYQTLDQMEIQHDLNFTCPLGVHSSYSKAQIMAALGYFNDERAPSFREGVKYFADKKLDVFFVTLNKSEKDFSPSTLYEDYAINERLFHWQTQSGVSEKTPTAQRYINHRELNHQVALFVREYRKENGYTAPFIFLGTVEYVNHSGNKPMSFKWKLKHPMPPSLVPKANKNIL
ncbi:DEAD/DEAH box helicase [Caldalkalibacillus salinus]|uniref:DEAD/DEAH box helicase n=1 Tax=Caldalkalibacillus salinus TaxID=2803787 RepID=UPI0019245CD5|nr:DEAD/DEAH box helicase [Caldalkalibacillus salinus]